MIKLYTRLLLISLLLISCKDMDEPVQLDFETSPNSLELLFSGEISTHLNQRDFTLSPDRNEIIYTLGNQDQSRRILVSRKKVNGIWGEPTVLPFSGTHQDIEPFFAPGGYMLFFTSNRPIYRDSTRTDYNIWLADQVNGEWIEPVALDSLINTKGQEYYPTISSSGNLYFTATRSDGLGLEDIYLSELKDGSYQTPKVLGSTINSASYEFNAFVNPEENLIIYSSYGRPDGNGGGDLYYSTKDANGNWQTAKNLDVPINSDKLDFCPFYDEKTGTLYFSSLRSNFPKTMNSVEEFIKLTEKPTNGLSSIYRITLKPLK